MKIAFDASDLCTGRADGTTRYTRELVSRLPRLDSQSAWNFYGPCVAPQDTPNISWHGSPFPAAWTQVRFPLELLRDRPDVLFVPIQQLPILRPWNTKTVAVIHDLAFHMYPEQFRYKDWLLLHTFTAQVAREADAIIAVSKATQEDIATYYGREKDVHVIYHGIDHGRFRVPSSEEKAAGKLAIQKAYPAITKPYILYVGQIQPRKNIARLVEAFEMLKEQGIQLVIAGGHGWHQQPILDRIASSSKKDSIVVTGAVADELLPALYSNAEAFVLPSLQEGFGIPILEAAACGVPVVTSNRSSMKELAQDAFVLVDPEQASSIAQGISHALHNTQELSTKSIARAKEFSWDTTAKQTLEVIKEVAHI